MHLETYVAYLFAHDPLGPSGDGSDGLIACGSYTGNGATMALRLILGGSRSGFLSKGTAGGLEWYIVDNMRGLTASMAGRFP
jgi:hypothetical protein